MKLWLIWNKQFLTLRKEIKLCDHVTAQYVWWISFTKTLLFTCIEISGSSLFSIIFGILTIFFANYLRNIIFYMCCKLVFMLQHKLCGEFLKIRHHFFLAFTTDIVISCFITFLKCFLHSMHILIFDEFLFC